MSTAQNYLDRAGALLEDAVEIGCNEKYARLQVAAAGVFADLARVAVEIERLELLDSRLIREGLAPDNDAAVEAADTTPREDTTP